MHTNAVDDGGRTALVAVRPGGGARPSTCAARGGVFDHTFLTDGVIVPPWHRQEDREVAVAVTVTVSCVGPITARVCRVGVLATDVAIRRLALVPRATSLLTVDASSLPPAVPDREPAGHVLRARRCLGDVEVPAVLNHAQQQRDQDGADDQPELQRADAPDSERRFRDLLTGVLTWGSSEAHCATTGGWVAQPKIRARATRLWAWLREPAVSV